jgi:hypothetical protein
MTLLWTAKANSGAYMIMWFGSLVAILICVAYYAKNIYPYNLESSLLDQDLEKLSSRLNEACTSMSFRERYNPRTEDGQLNITGSMLRMSTKRVGNTRVLVCDNPGLNVHLNLSQATFVVIAKNGSSTIRVWTE